MALWQALTLDLKRITNSWKENSAIVLTLALAVAASTALFALVHAILRPLPYPKAEQLVYILETNSAGIPIPAASPDVDDWRTMSHTLEAVASYGGQPITVLGGAQPVRVEGTGVSRDFFRVLQVRPALGRTFAAEEQQLHGSQVALVSNQFWREQLGGRDDAIGTPLRMLDTGFTVIGVMPKDFDYPNKTQIWISREIFPNSSDRTAHNDFVIARLKQGISVAEARIEIQNIGIQLQTKYPGSNTGIGVNIEPLQQHLLGEQKTALFLGFGVGICILIIAGANLTNLFISRILARNDELLLRTAFGASRAMILKNLMREALLLSLAGSGLGLLVTYFSIAAVRNWCSAWIAVDWLRIDLWVVVYALFSSATVACLAILVASVRREPASLAFVARGSSMTFTNGRLENGLRTTLVSTQIGIAFVICVSSGLLLRSWDRISSTPSGLRDDDDLLVANLSLPTVPGFEEAMAVRTADFYKSLLEQLSAIGGVRSVALTSDVPFSGSDHNGNFTIDSDQKSDAKLNNASFRIVNGDYFSTFGLRLLQGRLLGDQDDSRGQKVVVIDNETKKKYFSGRDPIGRRVRLDGLDSNLGWLTIVGVCSSVRDLQLTVPERPHMYVSYLQDPAAISEAGIVLRTTFAPSSFIVPVRQIVNKIQSDVVIEFSTTRNLLAASLTYVRARTSLIVVLSIIALTLSLIGVYALTSTIVRERRKEMAVRLAIGASSLDIVKFVVMKGLTPVLYGGIGGLVVSFWAVAIWRQFLYGISNWDPSTFLFVPVLMIGTSLLANLMPALYSLRIDAQQLLKEQ
jgi:putative ABC transport system permease protein